MVLHADKPESLFQVDSIIFDGFDQACPNCPGNFAISLWHRKKEVRNEVEELTVLAGWKNYNLLYICFPTIDSFPL